MTNQGPILVRICLCLFFSLITLIGTVTAQQSLPEESPVLVDPPEFPLLKVGATIEGEITQDDRIVETEILKNSYAQAPTRGKTFSLQVLEPGSYHIDLKSYFFDAYLVLRDARGTALAEDDDGLVATHAQVFYEFEVGGSYRIEVGALHGGTGPFEVVLAKGRRKELSPIEKSRLDIADAREAVRRLEAVRGPDHPDLARSLNNLGKLLFAQGRYEEVRPVLERALGIREEACGPDHPDVATSLNNLAAVHKAQGRYEGARPLYERSLGIREKVHGPDHPDVATSVDNLATLHYAQGRYEEALPLFERALGIRQKSLGPDHPNVAMSLNNLAAFYYAQGRYEEALPLFERSLGICEKAFGPDHPRVAASLNNLGRIHKTQGQYEEARPHYERSLKVSEKAFGSEHPDVARALNSLAVLLYTQGLFSEARPLYERSLKIREKSLGPDHPLVAESLNNLATLHMDQGRYSEARPLLEKSLGIEEKALGSDHSDVATSLHNLAVLFYVQGLFSEARPLYERSLKIREKSLGPDHPIVASTLNALGYLLYLQGLSSEGLPFLERSLKIREKSLGPDHPDVATSLNNLAVLLQSQGFFSEAVPLFERSLKIREKSLGPDHPLVALALNNLANLLYLQGRYEGVLRLHEKSFGIREKSLGPDHPDVAASLNSLALLESGRGGGRRAFEHARRAILLLESHLDSNLWSQTGSERLRFAAILRADLEIYLSVARRLAGGPDLNEVVTRILFWKGRVARSLSEDGGRRFSSLSPAERTIVEKLRMAQKRLSDALYSREITDRVAHGKLLVSLREQRRELERSLVRSQAEGEMERVEGGDASALQRALPHGSVAISFYVHRVYKPGEWRDEKLVGEGIWEPPRVSAFVVPAGEASLRWLDIGEASVLEEATKEFLDEVVTLRGVTLSQDETGKSSPTTAATDRLRELLWDPLRELVGESEVVIISADTFLGTLPFETLQEENGSYLVESRSFVYVEDLMSLVTRERERKAVPPRLFAVGGIDYGRRGKLDPEFLEERLVAQAETRGGLPPRWGRLSLTGQEADAIVGLFEETRSEDTDEDAEDAFTFLMRRKATEEAVKHHLERHSHIHLATHGYFQPEGLPSAWKKAQEEADKNRGGVSLEETEQVIVGLMPGLLSGLVLAGANETPEVERDNGLLTAEEVTYLDLSRCELVVLSACETGLGRPEGGEGMIGLRRSFRQSGARTVISSLWQVRDDSTQELMERFYENLWLEKMGKLEALRQAQLWMLRRNREEDGEGLPSTWGAFVLDGDWL